jgi:hypothetical protein
MVTLNVRIILNYYQVCTCDGRTGGRGQNNAPTGITGKRVFHAYFGLRNPKGGDLPSPNSLLINHVFYLQAILKQVNIN